jgi:hypothetical protein
MNKYPCIALAAKPSVWLLAAMFSLKALAATPVPVKPFRIIDTVCDIEESEISPKGQFVCRYVCRDSDHTKVAVVYSSAGSGQCRSPIPRTIKQTIKTTP